MYLFDGEYDIQTETNGVYTSILTVSAVGSDPAPLTIEPESNFLPPSVDAPWNTFGMINVAELSNNNDNDIVVTVSMRDSHGATITSSPLALRAHSKFDYIISDLVPADAYGTVHFSVAGSSTDAFRCDIAHYRLAQRSSKKALDFAFSIPCQIPNYGASAVLTNKNFPGRSSVPRSVSNWLTLTNLDDNTRTFTTRSYSEDGLLLETLPITLTSLARLDVEMSRLANISLVTITPDVDSSPYMAVLNRYDTGSSQSRSLAFGSHAQYGDSDARCVPISNLTSNDSYTEMANVADSATVVAATIYSSDGSVVDSGAIALPAHGVRHVSFAAQLPVDSAGSLCLDADFPESLVFNHATYLYGPDRELTTAFLTTPSKTSGVTSIFGAKNFFLNTFNWVRLMNLSDSTASVEIDSDPGESGEVIAGFFLSPHERRDIALHDSPFTRVLNTYGRFKVNGLVSADTVRVVPNTNNPATTNSVFTTAVR